MVDAKCVNAEERAKAYITKKDWRVRENSNMTYSFSSFFMNLAGEAVTDYTLSKIYPKDVAKAHLDGDMHIHNLYMGLVGYCAGWSIKDILLFGFNGVQGKVESSPPKHLSTALLQLANFLGTMQNEFAGAQALNSLDTYLAPFVRKDRLNYKQVKQQIQQFIYNLNISSRWGGQTPFTNITFDLKVPEDLKKERVIFGGKLQKDTYSNYQREMDMINQAFMETMIEGDMHGRIFTFPIPTYNITKDFDWDSKTSDLLFQMTAKYGIPYFQNFIKSDLNPRHIRAMCCHLLLDLKHFYRRVGGFFGYADKTGSAGVVTINMPRIGYLSKNEHDFFERLNHIMILAKNSLEIKRKTVEKNMKTGLLPFSKRYLGTLKWYFSTIGLIGMNEACLNFMGKDIATKEGQEFSIDVLEFMKNKIMKFQKETGNIYNLEATPAEGCSHRLARIDKKKYTRIKTAGGRIPYYTNSTNLPVGYTDDVFIALKHQEPLQTLYTGGTIFHTFLDEKPDWKSCKLLVKKIANNFKIPYFTITPTFSICRNHGYIKGQHQKCPKCKKPAEVYSRVVGYYRPIQNWHVGKQQEFRERLEYSGKKF